MEQTNPVTSKSLKKSQVETSIEDHDEFKGESTSIKLSISNTLEDVEETLKFFLN